MTTKVEDHPLHYNYEELRNLKIKAQIWRT